MLPSQVGGITGRNTDFAHLCLRLHCLVQAALSLSSGHVFVDLVAAFNRVIRELAFRIDCSDEAIASLFRDMGLPAAVFHRLRARLLAEPILHDPCVHEDLRHMVKECHVGTWWGTEGLAPIVATRIGSRAGDPFADLVFNFIMAEIVASLAKWLLLEDLIACSPWDGRRSLQPSEQLEASSDASSPSFVDDLVVLTQAPASMVVFKTSAILHVSLTNSLCVDWRSTMDLASLPFRSVLRVQRQFYSAKTCGSTKKALFSSPCKKALHLLQLHGSTGILEPWPLTPSALPRRLPPRRPLCLPRSDR